MTTKTLIHSINVALCLSCAIPRDAYAWWSSFDAGADTHKDITKDVLRNYLADQPLALEDYPDLVMFADELRDGSNFESHNLPDGKATDWWMPDNRDLWFTAGPIIEPAMKSGEDGSVEYGARWAYTNYFFLPAYTRIGYELHLLQDIEVPAHQNYCFHGDPVSNVDYLEMFASANHSYATTVTSWDYNYKSNIDGKVKEHLFQYWLADDMDDDDGDEAACWDDEVLFYDPIFEEWVFIRDGPKAYGVPDTDWGTYGHPSTVYLGHEYRFEISEELPGRDEGGDYFFYNPKLSIVNEQLQKAYVATLTLLKFRSRMLPPLIPDDHTNGKPTTSLDIFGPNKPVYISFYAMENRKPTVFVYILAGSSGIKNWHGKIWDGGANATEVLSSSSTFPWKSSISTDWNGDTSTGQIDDGTHEITMQIKDQDDHLSEKRTRSVMFDKTKPTGTITINGLSQSSNP